MSNKGKKFRKNKIININELDEQIRKLIDNKLAEKLEEQIGII